MKNYVCKSLPRLITSAIFFPLLISLKGDYINAEYLFEELEIDTSTKTEDDSSFLPSNPFELVEMIRRQNSMNDATNPSDAIDDALRSFNSLEENSDILIKVGTTIESFFDIFWLYFRNNSHTII